MEKCLEDFLYKAKDALSNISDSTKKFFGDDTKGNKLYYKLPKSIIIFINYRKDDKGEENPQNYFLNSMKI